MLKVVFAYLNRSLRCALFAALFSFLLIPAQVAEMNLSREDASRFANLVLNCVRREFPNKPDHVMRDPADVRSPKAQHPAFHGCFDWHSCVHGHWLLVYLLRHFPALPEAKDLRSALNEILTPENIKGELAYLDGPERKSFERTYGWAWLLKLEAELHELNTDEGMRWFNNLKPLAAEQLHDSRSLQRRERRKCSIS